MTSVDVRHKLVQAIDIDLVGPDRDSDHVNEILPQAPSRWYLTGFLVPSQWDKWHTSGEHYGDQGGASRFFYCPKASRSERNAGLEGMPEQPAGVMDDDAYVWPKNGDGSPRNKKVQPRANIHPTVKPLALTQWLCRLVTPLGGTVCDPFMGSGTTGKAALAEGFGFIGMELDAGYFEIAGARIAAAQADAPLFAG